MTALLLLLLAIPAGAQGSLFLGNQVAVAVFTVVFVGSLVVSLGGFNRSCKAFSKNSFSIQPDSGTKWERSIVVAHDRHPSKPSLAIGTDPLIHNVLCNSYKSQIFSRIVQSIAVYVIYNFPILRPHYDLVDGSRFIGIIRASSTNGGDRIPGIPLTAGAPFITRNFFDVGIVNYGGLALCERDYNHALIVP